MSSGFRMARGLGVFKVRLLSILMPPHSTSSRYLNVIPQRLQECPWSWPGVNNLASSSFQSEDIPKVVQNFGSFWGCFLMKMISPVKRLTFASHILYLEDYAKNGEIEILFKQSVMCQNFVNTAGLICQIDLALCCKQCKQCEQCLQAVWGRETKNEFFFGKSPK